MTIPQPGIANRLFLLFFGRAQYEFVVRIIRKKEAMPFPPAQRSPRGFVLNFHSGVNIWYEYSPGTVTCRLHVDDDSPHHLR